MTRLGAFGHRSRLLIGLVSLCLVAWIVMWQPVVRLGHPVSARNYDAHGGATDAATRLLAHCWPDAAPRGMEVNLTATQVANCLSDLPCQMKGILVPLDDMAVATREGASWHWMLIVGRSADLRRAAATLDKQWTIILTGPATPDSWMFLIHPEFLDASLLHACGYRASHPIALQIEVCLLQLPSWWPVEPVQMDAGRQLHRILHCLSRLGPVHTVLDVYGSSMSDRGSPLSSGLQPDDTFMVQSMNHDAMPLRLQTDLARGVRLTNFPLDLPAVLATDLLSTCATQPVDVVYIDSSAFSELLRSTDVAPVHESLLAACGPAIVVINNLAQEPRNAALAGKLAALGWAVVLQSPADLLSTSWVLLSSPAVGVSKWLPTTLSLKPLQSSSLHTWQPMQPGCASLDMLDVDHPWTDALGQLPVAPSLGTLRQLLLQCASDISAGQWPPADIELSQPEISPDLRFGRLLGCASRLLFVHDVIDVWSLSGVNLANLLAAGLAPGERLVGQLADKELYAGFNHHVRRDLSRGVAIQYAHNTGQRAVEAALEGVCAMGRVDFIVIDLGKTFHEDAQHRITAAANHRIALIKRCRPALVAVHNLNVHPDNQLVVQALLETGAWQILAHGAHRLPSVHQGCRRWVLLGNAAAVDARIGAGQQPMFKHLSQSSILAHAMIRRISHGYITSALLDGSTLTVDAVCSSKTPARCAVQDASAEASPDLERTFAVLQLGSARFLASTLTLRNARIPSTGQMQLSDDAGALVTVPVERVVLEPVAEKLDVVAWTTVASSTTAQHTFCDHFNAWVQYHAALGVSKFEVYSANPYAPVCVAQFKFVTWHHVAEEDASFATVLASDHALRAHRATANWLLHLPFHRQLVVAQGKLQSLPVMLRMLDEELASTRAAVLHLVDHDHALHQSGTVTVAHWALVHRLQDVPRVWDVAQDVHTTINVEPAVLAFYGTESGFVRLLASPDETMPMPPPAADMDRDYPFRLQVSAPTSPNGHVAVLIGASGFLAFHTALALHRNGTAVVALQPPTTTLGVTDGLALHRLALLEQQAIPVLPLQQCNSRILADVLTDIGATHVFYFGGSLHDFQPDAVAKDAVSESEDVLNCYVHLLEALRTLPRVKVVLPSSEARYAQSTRSIMEQDPPPTDRYPTHTVGALFASMELISHVYHHVYNIAIARVRVFDVYGPWMPLGKPMARLVRSFVTPAHGTTANMYVAEADLVFADDAAAALVWAAHDPAVWSTWDLGSGALASYDAVSQLITAIVEAQHAVQMTFYPDAVAPAHIHGHVAGSNGAELMPRPARPRTSLEFGVCATVSWYANFLGSTRAVACSSASATQNWQALSVTNTDTPAESQCTTPVTLPAGDLSSAFDEERASLMRLWESSLPLPVRLCNAAAVSTASITLTNMMKAHIVDVRYMIHAESGAALSILMNCQQLGTRQASKQCWNQMHKLTVKDLQTKSIGVPLTAGSFSPMYVVTFMLPAGAGLSALHLSGEHAEPSVPLQLCPRAAARKHRLATCAVSLEPLDSSTSVVMLHRWLSAIAIGGLEHAYLFTLNSGALLPHLRSYVAAGLITLRELPTLTAWMVFLDAGEYVHSDTDQRPRFLQDMSVLSGSRLALSQFSIPAWDGTSRNLLRLVTALSSSVVDASTGAVTLPYRILRLTTPEQDERTWVTDAIDTCHALMSKYGGGECAGVTASESLSDPMHAHHPGGDVATNKRVLVTGAAGFLGMHTSFKLVERGDTVLGVDNFYHYYTPALKVARLKQLQDASIPLVRADLCDGALIRALLRTHKFTHIVHLAAQPGVRYSIEHPIDVMRANVQCFLQLVESIRIVDPGIVLVYASSSSVYGLNEAIPFSEAHDIVQQSSLYGATKATNEVIAHAYHHMHSMSTTGLRFFTVYGAWGRPDMAYFGFADNIRTGRQVTKFRPMHPGQEIRRDFTFSDDIVAGIIGSVDLAAPVQIFNLGNSKPESLDRLLELVEKHMGPANIRLVDQPAADVVSTYADVSRAQSLLNYSPSVELERGLEIFFKWYKSVFIHQILDSPAS